MCIFAAEKQSIMDGKMISTLQSFFEKQPVEKAWVFGSFSRGEETKDSDVDIMVRFDPKARITLFMFSDMICSLKDLLYRDVDLVEEGQLMDFAVESANRDKILVYERAC